VKCYDEKSPSPGYGMVTEQRGKNMKKKLRKSKRLSEQPEPIDENRDYPFADSCYQSIDLLCYAEALDKKHKDPNYDLMKDKEFVEGMLA
jgi:hypothetical protein